MTSPRTNREIIARHGRTIYDFRPVWGKKGREKKNSPRFRFQSIRPNGNFNFEEGFPFSSIRLGNLKSSRGENGGKGAVESVGRFVLPFAPQVETIEFPSR